MSTSIKSFGQPSNITVSSYENGGSTTVSSFGPKACLRLRADASVWSKSGGSVQIRGIGNKTFLHAKELRLVQPVEIRFKLPNGAKRMMVNQYLDASADYAGTNSQEDMTEWRGRATDFSKMELFNGVHAVENGLFRSMSNLVLSINGSSWQVRPSSFIDAFDKLFSDCRYNSEGQPTACPPYTSATRPFGSQYDQPGNKEACQSFIQNARVKWINKSHADGDDGARVIDIVYEVDFVSKLPIGPLAYASHPALTNLTDNDIHALPHIHDLSLEWSYKQNNPLMYWIKTCSTDIQSGMSVDCGNLQYGQNVVSGNTLNFDGTSGIDTAGMWATAVARSTTIASNTAEDKAIYLNLLRPYVTYTLTEAPLARINYKPLYTVPSIRFTTYQQDTAIAATDATGRVNFEYIQVDSLSSLVCLSVFDSDRDGPGGAVGCRQPRWKNGTFVYGRKGAEFQNITCPIRWDTLKINLSVENSVLGSLTGGLETQFDMYRVFLKYSKSKVSFNDWSKYCQMVVFSPMELTGGGLGLETKPISLSISFDYERTASDTLLSARDWGRDPDGDFYPKINRMNGSSSRGDHLARNYQASLFFLHQEVCTLSPGQAGIELLSFSPQEVQSAFTGASRTLENPVLDQFVS